MVPDLVLVAGISVVLLAVTYENYRRGPSCGRPSTATFLGTVVAVAFTVLVTSVYARPVRYGALGVLVVGVVAVSIRRDGTPWRT